MNDTSRRQFLKDAGTAVASTAAVAGTVTVASVANAAVPESELSASDEMHEAWYATERAIEHLAELIAAQAPSKRVQVVPTFLRAAMTTSGHYLAEARLVDSHSYLLDEGGYSDYAPVPEDCWRANRRLKLARG